MSRSQKVKINKQNVDNLIILHRSRDIEIPKTIKFIRKNPLGSNKIYLAENRWLDLPEILSQKLTEENSIINSSAARHVFPSSISTSVYKFFETFRINHCYSDDKKESDMNNACVDSVQSLFQKHIMGSLLYLSESSDNSITRIIKEDPLRNTPAIFVLRFIYFIPTLFEKDDPDSEHGQMWRNFFKKLTDFAAERHGDFFVFPSEKVDLFQPKPIVKPDKTASKHRK